MPGNRNADGFNPNRIYQWFTVPGLIDFMRAQDYFRYHYRLVHFDRVRLPTKVVTTMPQS